LIGLACAKPAWGYRPFDFSDADVADAKTIEIEIAPVEFVERGPEHTLRMPNLGVTFGLGGGYEFAVEGVNQVALGRAEGEPRSRLSDAGAAIKRLVRRGTLQDATGVSVATEGRVLFPTRDAAHLGAEASGIVSNAWKAGVVHAQLDVRRLPEGSDGAGGAVIVESADHRGWRPVAEFMLEGVRGEPSDKGVLIGSIYEAREGLAFDVGAHFGQSEGVRWTEVRTGMTWQIGPRGTAPLRHFARFHLRRRHRETPD
jgi:hypothetical protein